MNYEFEPLKFKPEDCIDESSLEFDDPLFDFRIPIKPVKADNPWVNELRDQSERDLIGIYGVLQNPFKNKRKPTDVTLLPNIKLKFRALHDGAIIEFTALVDKRLQSTLMTFRCDPVIKPKGRVLEQLLGKYPVFEILGVDITEYTLSNSLGDAQFARERLILDREYIAATSNAD